MNLRDTVSALDNLHVTVALDIGVHERCGIDSNCPIAIQLRRIITDAEITLPQLLEGFNEVVVEPLEIDEISLEDIDGTARVMVYNTEVSVDLTSFIHDRMQGGLRNRLSEIEHNQAQVRNLGYSYHSTYQEAMRRLRDTRTLPQRGYMIEAMIADPCYISALNGNYLYFFPTRYNPRYIVSDGIRYQLSDVDVERTSSSVLIRYTISVDNRILSSKIVGSSGGYFPHYHGSHRDDCWGNVIIPRVWDGSLHTLTVLTHTLMNSMGTINQDSLMDSEPGDMPHITELRRRSTELGREGERTGTTPRRRRQDHNEGIVTFEIGIADIDAVIHVAEPAPRTGWGRRE